MASTSEILEETISDKKGSVEDRIERDINFPEDFPPKEKEVLSMLFQQQMTLKEISVMMDISREKVRQLKEKGLRRLKASGTYTK